MTDSIVDNGGAEERKRRVQFTLILFTGFLGVLIISIMSELKYEYRFWPLPAEIYIVMGWALIAFSGFTMLMTYLQTGMLPLVSRNYSVAAAAQPNLRVQHEVQTLTERVAELQDEINRIHQSFSEERATILSVEDRAKIATQLKARVFSEANETLLDELKKRAAEEIVASKRERDIRELLQQTRARLQEELAALGWRGNVNLVLGGLTTIVGLVILWRSVFSGENLPKDMLGFVSHFAPRVTLVLFIELFAYFFLSLYKTSLTEIKYFQNELTNVESKQVALLTAIEVGDASTISSIVSTLSVTERNHILTKEQTTLELEKVRLEKSANNELMKFVMEFFQKK